MEGIGTPESNHLEGIGTPESHDWEGIGTPESHDMEGIGTPESHDMEGIGTPESHDMEGIGTPESHDLEGEYNTFGNIVYAISSLYILLLLYRIYILLLLYRIYGANSLLSALQYNGRQYRSIQEGWEGLILGAYNLGIYIYSHGRNCWHP
ncbi:unnamed protein product [Staurois parvus]|uniref:Uncharacterized protein n=1 Tax=Staurois parvus TaxID=386267 RepID=A0ABN9EKQ4_9NEOB|nr:unnamed protein product [Staurois parvus]